VWATAPPSPLLAVPNVTAHPSTARVPTSCYLMWHYNCFCALKSKISVRYAHCMCETVITDTVSVLLEIAYFLTNRVVLCI